MVQATLFGRDLSTIPCFRSSFLNGIGGGIASGLAYFMFTSKVRQACNTAVLSFAGITLTYWYLCCRFCVSYCLLMFWMNRIYCRYRWSQRKFHMEMIRAVMKDQVINEGTDKDPRLTTEQPTAR